MSRFPAQALMKRSATRSGLQSPSSPSTSQKLLACLSYGTVSISITLFNKAVFSVYGFRYPNFVTTLQILVSLFYMHLLKSVGMFHFGSLSFKTARQVWWSAASKLPVAILLTESNAAQLVPLVLFWWLYVVSGVTALRYLTVPMFR